MANKSVSDELLLGYLIETTWGVIPSTAMQLMRITGETLKSDLSKSQSNEIRSDRNIQDMYIAQEQASGAINCLMSYANSDKLKEHALESVFSSSYAYSASTISIDNTTGTLSLNDTATGFTTASLIVGSWFRFQTTGVLNPAIVYARVVSVTTSKIVFTTSQTIVTEVALLVKLDHNGTMRDGKLNQSLVLEKDFSDVTQFFNSIGMVSSSYAIEIGTGTAVTEVFEFLGKKQSRTTSTVGTGSALTAPNNNIMVAGLHTKNLDVNGSNLCFSSMNINVDNSVEARGQINDITPCSIAERQRKVTGSFGTYFENGDFYDLYKANGSFGITIPIIDDLGQGYLFSMPDCKLDNDGDINASSSDSDVTPSFNYTAVALAKDYVIQITRFSTLP